MNAQHTYRPDRTVPAGVLIWRTLGEEPEPLPRPHSLYPDGRVRVVNHEPSDPLPDRPAATPDFPSFAGELPLIDSEDSPLPC